MLGPPSWWFRLLYLLFPRVTGVFCCVQERQVEKLCSMMFIDVHWCSLCFISMVWFLFSASTSCHLRSVHAVFCHLQLGETWFIMGWRERRNPLNCLVDGNFKHCKKAAIIFNQSTSAHFEFKQLQPRDGTMEVEAPTTRHFPCWAWRAMDAGTCSLWTDQGGLDPHDTWHESWHWLFYPLAI